MLFEKERDIPCVVGILAMENIRTGAPGDRLKCAGRKLESALRKDYGQATRGELKALHPMDVYIAYYKKFGYTYHVLPQLESVLKGKEIPLGLAPVEAMFLAELKNQLLTAGHDLDKIQPPLGLQVSDGRESMLSLSGRISLTVPGDLLIRDRQGVISSILRGPDSRTAITEETRRVLYTVYAPEGVEEQLVLRHLEDIEGYVHLAFEDAVTLLKQVF